MTAELYALSTITFEVTFKTEDEPVMWIGRELDLNGFIYDWTECAHGSAMGERICGRCQAVIDGVDTDVKKEAWDRSRIEHGNFWAVAAEIARMEKQFEDGAE